MIVVVQSIIILIMANVDDDLSILTNVVNAQGSIRFHTQSTAVGVDNGYLLELLSGSERASDWFMDVGFDVATNSAFFVEALSRRLGVNLWLLSIGGAFGLAVEDGSLEMGVLGRFMKGSSRLAEFNLDSLTLVGTIRQAGILGGALGLVKEVDFDDVVIGRDHFGELLPGILSCTRVKFGGFWGGDGYDGIAENGVALLDSLSGPAALVEVLGVTCCNAQTSGAARRLLRANNAVLTNLRVHVVTRAGAVEVVSGLQVGCHLEALRVTVVDPETSLDALEVGWDFGGLCETLCSRVSFGVGGLRTVAIELKPMGVGRSGARIAVSHPLYLRVDGNDVCAYGSSRVASGAIIGMLKSCGVQLGTVRLWLADRDCAVAAMKALEGQVHIGFLKITYGGAGWADVAVADEAVLMGALEKFVRDSQVVVYGLSVCHCDDSGWNDRKIDHSYELSMLLKLSQAGMPFWSLGDGMNRLVALGLFSGDHQMRYWLLQCDPSRTVMDIMGGGDELEVVERPRQRRRLV